MKATALILTTIITVVTTHLAIAEFDRNMMPPPGPYRLMNDAGQYNLKQKTQNSSQVKEKQGYSSTQPEQISRDVPEWVKQRQMQMLRWMKQSNRLPMQAWDNQSPQRNYYQATPMQNPYYGRNPNSMQQSYPFARAPMYGVDAPSSEYYRQPGYMTPRY